MGFLEWGGLGVMVVAYVLDITGTRHAGAGVEACIFGAPFDNVPPYLALPSSMWKMEFPQTDGMPTWCRSRGVGTL